MVFEFFVAFLCVVGGSARSASIVESVPLEELHMPGGISEKVAVVEEEPIHVAEEIIRLEVEEPKMIEHEEEDDGVAAPFEVTTVDGEETAPILSEDDNCEKPKMLVEEQLIERAERQADQDLIKALDTVLSKKETIEDVIRSEQVAIPPL